jgi:hypothetical protein
MGGGQGPTTNNPHGGESQETYRAKQVLYRLTHTSCPFCCGYFEAKVLQTICLGWPQTMILLISASHSSWDYRSESLASSFRLAL